MAPTPPLSFPLTRRAIGDNLERDASILLILPVIGTLTVAARVLLRRYAAIKIGLDDLLLGLSLPFLWGLWGAFYHCTTVVVPTTISTMPPEALPTFLKLCFIEEFLYVNGANIIKFSILAFYHRCFCAKPLPSRAPKFWLYGIAGVLACYTVTRFLITLLECRPIAYFWDRTLNGSCVDLKVMLISLQGFNLVAEVAILAYPVPLIWSLDSLPRHKKIGLIALFALGLLACASSAFRIYYVSRIFGAGSESLLSDGAMPKLSVCAMAEMVATIILASAPAMRMPLLKLFGKGKGSRPASSASGSQHAPAAVTKGPADGLVRTTTREIYAAAGFAGQGAYDYDEKTPIEKHMYDSLTSSPIDSVDSPHPHDSRADMKRLAVTSIETV